MDPTDLHICELEQQVARVTEVLSTLLSWMGQSAVCPLSRQEIEILLRWVEDAK